LGDFTRKLGRFCSAPDGRIVLVRADKKQPLARFAKLRGHAGEGLGTDAILALTRGDE
jgi:hypothetical protein